MARVWSCAGLASSVLLAIARSAWGAPAAEPRFAELLDGARRAQKVLVVDFGTEHCAPCKALQRDLEANRRSPGPADVLIVQMNMARAGREVATKMSIETAPTLLAVAPDGREIDRWIGYDGRIDPVIDWLRTAAHRILALEDTLREADRLPTDGPLQLLAGRRLVAAARGQDGRAYFDRATRSRRGDVVAAAMLELGALDGRAAAASPESRAAEAVLTRHPDTPAAMKALERVVEHPSTPRPLIAKAIQAHANAHRKNLRTLDRLFWLALRAGLPQSADDLRSELATGDGGSSLQDIYAVELHHARGETAEALSALKDVRLSRRVYGPLLQEIETRLQRTPRAPPPQPAMESLRQAAQVLIKATNREANLERWQKRRLEEEISRSCSGDLGGRRSIRLYVLAENDYSAALPQLADALPHPAVMCINRTFSTVAPFYRRSQVLTLDLGSVSWLQDTARAARDAEGSCFTELDRALLDDEAAEVMVRSGESRVDVDLPPTLRHDTAACIRKRFSAVPPSRGAVRVMHIAPAPPPDPRRPSLPVSRP